MNRTVYLVVFGAAIGVAAAACGFAQSEDAMSAGGPPGGGGAGLGGDAGIDANVGDAEAGHGPTGYAHLCGDGCVPGLDADPCDGTADGGAGDGGAGGGGGADSAPQGCQLVYDAQAETVHGQCAPVGESIAGGPCLTSSDCALGLACVAPEQAGPGGKCRPYCCGDLEECPSETFCHPEPVAEGYMVGNEPLKYPVCVPATDCTLLDDTTCDEGTTCTIVRVDGTTSCVEPGSGELGDPCPCAAGYVCSTKIDECMKLCKISRAGDCPDGFSCQGGSTAYPQGFGVCVGSN
jgi:hypothetical protein